MIDVTRVVSVDTLRGQLTMDGETQKQGSLLRILGLAFGIAAVMGGMVGQGILRTPGIVAGAAHSPQLIVALWLIGAALVAVSAFAYVELGVAIPCAGGPYDFIRRAFGELSGIVAGWAGLLAGVSSLAFTATVVGEFLHRLGVLSTISVPVLAVALLLVLGALNWTGTRIAGDSQIVFSGLKGIALMALILLLFSRPGSPQPSTGQATAAVGLTGLAVGMRVIMSTYNGWQGTVFYGEELAQPERTLPRSMAIGIIGVAALYLLVNLALLHVLSPLQMANSNLPAADAAKAAIGNIGELGLTAFGVLSVVAITNLNVMRYSRLPFAMAREGHLPARLSYVAKSGTPGAALLTTIVLAAAFAATGTFETIIAMNVALVQALVVAVNIAAVRLRHKEPELKRSFRISLYPLPVIIAVVVNLALLAALIYEDPLHSLEGFVLLAIIGTGYAVVGSGRRDATAKAP